MNWRAIQAIIRRDLKVVVQSKAVLIPLIIVPLTLLILLPGLGGLFLANVDPDSAELTDFRDEMEMFFDNLPGEVNAELDALDNEVQRITHVMFLYFFAPMYLILPLMVANVIAADSFVGEKERKTLEALLYTPTTESELYIAKLLSPWIAGTVIAWVGFLAYAVVVNVTTWSVMGGVFFPNVTWLVLALWVAPAAAGLGLGAMVLVSSRVNTFQEAYQLGGVVVIPVVLLLLGQAGGVVYFNLPVVLGLGLFLWLVDLAILWVGIRSFNRGALLARL